MDKEHKNEFKFNAIKGVSVAFWFPNNAGDHIVTDGQPYSGVDVENNADGSVTIIVNAGRKGSTECADWFKAFVGSNGKMMIHTGGGDNLPEKLNFAIKGKLTIDKEDFEVCLGQGHRDGGMNNWHLASKSIIADTDAKGGVIGIRLQQNGSHTFDVSKPDLA